MSRAPRSGARAVLAEKRASREASFTRSELPEKRRSRKRVVGRPGPTLDVPSASSEDRPSTSRAPVVEPDPSVFARVRTRSMNASSDCHLPRVSWSASRFARRSAFRTRSSAASSASAGAYAPCGAMHVWRCGVMKSKMCVHASRIRISDGTWSSKGRCACRVRGSAERKSSCFTSRKTTTRPALGRTAKSRSGNQSSPPASAGGSRRRRGRRADRPRSRRRRLAGPPRPQAPRSRWSSC